MIYAMSQQDEVYYPLPPEDPLGKRFRVFAVGRGQSAAAVTVDGMRHDLLKAHPHGVAVLQICTAGQGFIQGPDGRRVMIENDMGLCLRFPGHFQYGIEAGQSWRRIWMTLSGDTALELMDTLSLQCGLIVKEKTQGLKKGLRQLFQAAANEQPHDELASKAFALLTQVSSNQGAGDRTHPEAIMAALAVVRRRIHDPSLSIDDFISRPLDYRVHILVAVSNKP